MVNFNDDDRFLEEVLNACGYSSSHCKNQKVFFATAIPVRSEKEEQVSKTVIEELKQFAKKFPNAHTDMGRISKYPQHFKLHLEFDKEMEIAGLKITVEKHATDKDAILVNIAKGYNTEQIYLGPTNDFENGGFIGYDKIEVKILTTYISKVGYRPYLYGTIYE